MSKRKTTRNSKKYFRSIFVIFLFIFISTVAFVGIQFITKTGLFKIPGVLKLDPSLSSHEAELLKSIFTDEITLSANLTISATTTTSKPSLSNSSFLYQVLVPVTDFYSEKTSISHSAALELANQFYSPPLADDHAFASSISAKTHALDSSIKLIDIQELKSQNRLLAIDDAYYLDDFSAGAIFRTLTLTSENYETEIAPLVKTALTKSFPDKSTVLTFAETGVTALSRGMNKKLNQVNDATYFSANIKDFLSSFDLTHISNEASFSKLASGSNICSDPSFINTLTAIGVDIVELTGNHNQDCGDVAASETIDTYRSLNLKLVGGGKNAAEAAIPLQISNKDTHITMLAYNQSTGGATHGSTPGANQYYEENAVKNIKAAKSRGDFVIVNIQYYECSDYDHKIENISCDRANSSAGDQVGFFRHLIDLGADLVVGTAAHQPQTFELYNHGAIYYGLGNLFFDQSWWPGTTRSLILAHYFYNNQLLQTRLVPTVYDANLQTTLMDKETATWFLNRLKNSRP